MIGYLEAFSRLCIGPLKDHTGIIKGSKCNHTSLLKGSPEDMDTNTVGTIPSYVEILPDNTTTNSPLSSFGSPVLHTLIRTDDVTDPYCTSSAVLVSTHFCRGFQNICYTVTSCI